MVPVGIEVPLAGLTVAVSVTGEFCVMDAAEVVNVVVVLTAAEFTLTVVTLEVDALKVLVPAYKAVMAFEPTGSEEVEREAVPAVSDVVPSEVAWL